eukprot:m.341210 g.341210  ORF g.341210 m.341210 type:complete len:4293 (-) comp16110_c0_seq1:197-13075(-)
MLGTWAFTGLFVSVICALVVRLLLRILTRRTATMLSNVVFWVLKKYLADYFQNLDAAELKLSVLSGNVQLSNLHLKKEVLQHELDLPLEIVSGIVGLMTIDVSWTQLFSKPIRVRLDEVTLLIKPTGDQKIDPEKLEQLRVSKKKKLLEDLNSSEKDGSSEGNDDLFSSKSLFRIVSNLQVDIQRIHIRYEDTGELTHCPPFTAGATLTELKAISVDKSGVAVQGSISDITAHKKLSIQGLSVYVNPSTDESDFYGHRGAAIRSSMVSVFKSRELTGTMSVIGPIALTGLVSINKKVMLDDKKLPQFDVELIISELALSLRQTQLHRLLHTGNHLAFEATRMKHRQSRPSVPVKGNAKTWWKFAIDESLKDWRDRRKRFTPSFLSQRRQERLSYVMLYKRLLTNKITKLESRQLEQLEMALELDDIRFYRKAARASLPKQKKAGLLSRLFSSKKSSEPDIEREYEQSQQQLREMLQQDADYETPEDIQYVGTIVNLSVVSFDLEMVDDSLQVPLRLFHVTATALDAAITQRPAAESTKVATTLQSISATVQASLEADSFVLLHSTAAKEDSMFSLTFETNPLPVQGQPKIDSQCRVVLAPLVAELRPLGLKALVNFFAIPEDIQTDDLSSFASYTVVEAKEQMRIGLQYAIETRKNFDLSVDAAAPIVKIVCDSLTVPNEENMLLLDLGHLYLGSDLHHETRDLTTVSLDELSTLAYDHFNVSLENLQLVLLSGSNITKWQQRLEDQATEDHLLDAFTISATLSKCLRLNDVRLPQMKIKTELPCLALKISEQQIGVTYEVIMNFLDQLGLMEQPTATLKSAYVEDFNASEYTTSLRQRELYNKFLDSYDIEEGSGSDSTAEDALVSAVESSSELDVSSVTTTAAKKRLEMAHIRQLQIEAEILCVTLQVCKTVEQQRVPVVSLDIYSVYFRMLQRPFDSDMTVSLSGLALVTFSTGDIDSSRQHLIYTTDRPTTTGTSLTPAEIDDVVRNEASRFATADIKSSSVRNPLFAKSFNSTELAISAHIMRIAIDLAEDAVILLMHNLFPVLNHVLASISHTDGLTAPPLPEEEKASQDTKELVKHTLLSVECTFDGLEILLSRQEQHLTVFSLNSVSASVVQNLAKTKIHMVLGQPYLRDFSQPTSRYPFVLFSFEDSEFLNVNVTIPDEPSLEEPPLSLVVKTGRLRLIVLPQYITMLLHFTDNVMAGVVSAVASTALKPVQDAAASISAAGGSAVRSTPSPSTASAPAALMTDTTALASPTDSTKSTSRSLGAAIPAPEPRSKSITSADSSSTAAHALPEDPRIHLDIIVASPQVLLPLANDSKHFLALDLGRLRVTTAALACFHDGEQGVPSVRLFESKPVWLLYQLFHAELKDMCVTQGELADTSKGAMMEFRQSQQLARFGDFSAVFGTQLLQAETFQSFKKLSTSAPDKKFYSDQLFQKSHEFPHPTILVGVRDILVDVQLGTLSVGVDPHNIRTILQAVDTLSAIGATEAKVSSSQIDASVKALVGASLQDRTVEYNPVSSASVHAFVQWPQLDLTMYAQTPAQKHQLVPGRTKHAIANVNINNIQVQVSLGGIGKRDMFATVELAGISIKDQTQSSSGKTNFFTDILDTTKHSAATSLSLDLATNRHIACIKGKKGALTQSLLKPLLEASASVKDTLEQQNAPVEAAATLVEFFEYQELVTFMQDARKMFQDNPDIKVLPGPANETEASLVFSGLNLNVTPPFLSAVMKFVADIGDVSGSKTSQDPTTPLAASTSMSITSPGSEIARVQSLSQGAANASPAGEGSSSGGVARNGSTDGGANTGLASHMASGKVVPSFRNSRGETYAEPAASDSLITKARIRHPTIVLIDDPYSPHSRQISVDCIIRFDSKPVDGVQSTTVTVDALTAVSKVGQFSHTRFECISPSYATVSICQETTAMKVDVTVEQLNVNLAYADIKTIVNVAGALGELGSNSFTQGQQSDDVPWTRQVEELTGSEHLDFDELVATQTSGIAEYLKIDVPAVNVTLINTVHDLRMPLLAISLSASGLLNNWSSCISGNLDVALAVAALEPRNTAWEPVLLGYCPSSDSQVTKAHELTVNIATDHDGFLRSGKIKVHSSSPSTTFPTDDPDFTGGDASLLLEASPNTFWCPQDTTASLCDQPTAFSPASYFVVFEMSSNVRLQRFSYDVASLPGRDLSGHMPKSSVLEVSNQPDGPYVVVADITTKASNLSHVASNVFSRAGKYWRWRILSTFHNLAPFVAGVQFELQTKGSKVDVVAKNRMEFTVTSNTVNRLVNVATSWLDDLTVGQKMLQHSDEAQVAAEKIGTHTLVNQTGTHLSFCPSNVYDSTIARRMIVHDGGRCVFTPKQQVRPDYTDTMWHQHAAARVQVKPPITDIIVVNQSKGERAPNGYKLVKKNLNEGSPGNELYLAYSRNPSMKPITELHVSFVDGCASKKKGIKEPLPSGFSPVAVDLNSGTGIGNRRIILSLFRGRGAPITDISVVFLYGSFAEAIPAGFTFINKNLNRGRTRAENPYLCYRRQDVRWSPSLKQSALWPKKPITALTVKQGPVAAEDHETVAGVVWENTRINVNAGSSAPSAVLYVSRDQRWDPITHLIFQNNSAPHDASWETLNTDLNEKGRSLFFHYRRDPGAAAIKDIVSVTDNEAPTGSVVLWPSVNSDTSFASALYLAYTIMDVPEDSWVLERAPDADAVSRLSTATATSEHDPKARRAAQLMVLSLLQTSEHAMTSISMEVAGYYPVESISISATGEEALLLKPVDEEKTAVRCIVSVEIVNDLKRIVVRSPLFVYNTLPFPIYLNVPMSIDDNSVTTKLLPNQSFSPPLGSIDGQARHSGTKNLYRFWSPVLQHHYYTTNPVELSESEETYVEISILGCVYTEQHKGTVPLYSSLSSNMMHDVFIADPSVKFPRGSVNLASEGEVQHNLTLVGYIPADPKADSTVSIFRFHQKMTDDMLITSDPTEINLDKKSFTSLGKSFHLLRHPGLVRVKQKRDQPWSKMHESLKLSKYPATRVLTCMELRDVKFACTMSSFTPNVSTTFCLEEPIKVRNQLPCSVLVTLLKADGTLAHPVMIEPGETQGVYTLQDYDTVTMRMILAQDPAVKSHFESGKPFSLDAWSSACSMSLQDDVTDYTTTVVVRRDEAGAVNNQTSQLLLGYHMERKSRFRSPSVTLFAPCLVMDTTVQNISLRPVKQPSAMYEFHNPSLHTTDKTLKAQVEERNKCYMYSPVQGLSCDTVLSTQAYQSDAVNLGDLLAGASPVSMKQVDSQQKASRHTQEKIVTLKWKWLNSQRLTKVFTVSTNTIVKNEHSAPILISYAVEGFTANQPQHLLQPNESWVLDIPAGHKSSWKFTTNDHLDGCRELSFDHLPAEVFTSFTVRTPSNNAITLGDPNTASTSTATVSSTDVGDGEQDEQDEQSFAHHSDGDGNASDGLDQSMDVDYIPLLVDYRRKAKRTKITIKSPPLHPPIRVENHTNTVIQFKQSGVAAPELHELRPSEATNFVFDDPCVQNPQLDMKALSSIGAGRMSIVSGARSTDFVPVSNFPDQPVTLTYWQDRQQQSIVVAVVPDHKTGTCHFICAPSRESVRIIYGLEPTVPTDEAVQLSVQFKSEHGLGVSLIDSFHAIPIEFAYVCLAQMNAQYVTTTTKTSIEASIGTLQLDFQARSDRYKPPVLFFQPQLPSDEGPMPVVYLRLIQKSADIGSGRNIDTVQDVTLRVLPFIVTVDGLFVTKLLSFLNILDSLPESSSDNDEAPQIQTPVFYQKVDIRPIDASISFNMTDELAKKLPPTFRGLASTLANLHNVPFKLSSIEIEQMTMEPSKFTEHMSNVLIARLWMWMFQIGLVGTILSLDVIGDPLTLFTDVAGGIKSLFYDPFTAVRENPSEFGSAVAKGAVDLGTGVIGGAFGAGAKMTSAAGRGLAALTFDDDYQEERRRAMDEGSTSATKGLAAGMKRFGMGLVSGVTGVVTTPFQEGRKGGIGKGVVGFGKGLVGLVTKPVGGAVDMVSSTLSAVESTVKQENVIPKIRLPRHVRVDGCVVPYSSASASGMSLVHENSKLAERFGHMTYIGHTEEKYITNGKEVQEIILGLSLAIAVIGREGNSFTVTQECDARKLVSFKRLGISRAIELCFEDGTTIRLSCTFEYTLPKLVSLLVDIINLHHKQTHMVRDELVFDSKLQSDQTIETSLWEYERLWDGSWKKRFLPTDHFKAWTLVDDEEVGYDEQSDVQALPGFAWSQDWKLHSDVSECNADGWQYAPSPQDPFKAIHTHAQVRRRKWIRAQKGATTTRSLSTDAASEA